ncbi:septum formation family protein [Streptomyces sp. NBC_01304]|uniref:septum formation family protein n=1 Tax=Streptomyces sp. NBC_01304 TaxID=2903818 RepID=UPI003FA39339
MRCTAPHQLETYATAELHGAVAAEEQRPSPYWLLREARTACAAHDVNGYLGAGQATPAYRPYLHTVVPTAKEWNAGERTVRCDVGVPGAEMPGTRSGSLKGALLREAGAPELRHCRYGGADIQCSEFHDRELVSDPVVFGPDIGRLGRGRIRAISYERCRAAAVRYLGAGLTERRDVRLHVQLPGTEQTEHPRVARCWLVVAAEGKTIRGSLYHQGRSVPSKAGAQDKGMA